MLKVTQDEWVVCRVFMKSSSGKKYLSSQPRGNPYHHHLGMVQPEACHFGVGGRGYLTTNADLVELSRFARGTPGSNLPIQPQFNFPPYNLSGLNVNLGPLRTMPVPLAQQPQLVPEPPSSMLANNCVMAADGGFMSIADGVVTSAGTGVRYHQQMDPCVEFDQGYWPSY